MRNSSRLLVSLVSFFSLVSIDCLGMITRNGFVVQECYRSREIVYASNDVKMLLQRHLKDPRSNDRTLVIFGLDEVLVKPHTASTEFYPLSRLMVDVVRSVQSKVRVLALSTNALEDPTRPNENFILSKLVQGGFNFENSWVRVAQQNLQPNISFQGGTLFCRGSSIAGAVESFLDYLQNHYRYVGTFSKIVYVDTKAKNVNYLKRFCRTRRIKFIGVQHIGDLIKLSDDRTIADRIVFDSKDDMIDDILKEFTIDGK